MTDYSNQYREFWLEFGGDPSDDKEVYKRYTSTSEFKPVFLDHEVIHVIEYKAVKALQAENERLKTKLKWVTPTEDVSLENLVNYYKDHSDMFKAEWEKSEAKIKELEHYHSIKEKND